jgi:hypothetical protein
MAHASNHLQEVTKTMPMPAGPGTKSSSLEPALESSGKTERENLEEKIEEERRYDDEESDADEPRPPADS